MKTILIFFGILFLLLIIWDLCTRKYLNPYTMDLYIANKGAGKSSTLAKNTIKALKHHEIVYTNAKDIKVNGVRIFDTYDLGKKYVENSYLLVDEISLFFDNRNYKNTSKEFIEWLREVRHDRLKVDLFSQSYDC